MPNKNAQFTYSPEDSGLTFAWGGGAYIDVFADGAEAAGETINVWDYEKDVPNIDRTLAAFQAECDEWLKSQAEDA